ncbi:MAG TPA: hypothetical protein VMT28_11840 [Terriglobales bacterium]|jgi:hypothetical protein|nr:hypothetical protein [Terriglobales bacterium]
MRIPSLQNADSRLVLALAFAVLLLLPACSINVKKDKTGAEKKVDIETPVGGIHVTNNADVRDVGLPVYPGARVKEKGDEGEEKSANVNISSGLFGLKVVAIEYESDDPPEKLIAYYKDQLKKYGNVLECHTSRHGGHVNIEKSPRDSEGSRDVKCDSNDSGRTVELKVGTEDNQHVVAIEPRDKGCDFALVYVKTRGKDTI